ncbi:MAG: hypothetical protein ACLSHC_08270 [Bilophila wadsworthia]
MGRHGIELTHEIMYRHYRRDEDFVYAQMAEGVTWIGPSRAQYTTGVDKLRELLQIEQLVTFTMEQETYQVAYEDEHSCLIFGCCTVTSDEETGLFIRTLQRVSFFYRLIGDRLHVVHMHCPTLTKSWIRTKCSRSGMERMPSTISSRRTRWPLRTA